VVTGAVVVAGAVVVGADAVVVAGAVVVAVVVVAPALVVAVAVTVVAAVAVPAGGPSAGAVAAPTTKSTIPAAPAISFRDGTSSIMSALADVDAMILAVGSGLYARRSTHSRSAS
jgi:hypothetical protein